MDVDKEGSEVGSRPPRLEDLHSAHHCAGVGAVQPELMTQQLLLPVLELALHCFRLHRALERMRYCRFLLQLRLLLLRRPLLEFELALQCFILPQRLLVVFALVFRSVILECELAFALAFRFVLLEFELAVQCCISQPLLLLSLDIALHRLVPQQLLLLSLEVALPRLLLLLRPLRTFRVQFALHQFPGVSPLR
jgi:hypothetical protein